jgi:hypothetical protein
MLRSLADMLQREVDVWKMLGVEETSLKEIVLEHGQPYELDREASHREGRGYLGNCFQNAAMTALFDDSLTYVEGFAHKGNMPVHHAWVINQAGKALEVTWLDGGRECGFCADGERTREEGDEGYDEDDESTWTDICPHCGGTGEAPYEHNTLECAEYYGIAVDSDTLRTIVQRNKLWGVLHMQRDLDAVLAARR